VSSDPGPAQRPPDASARHSCTVTGHLYRSSRVRTCSSLAGIGLVYFVIGHTFGIWQAFGDALPGLAVAPGWQRHIDDRPSSPGKCERIGLIDVVDPEWSMPIIERMRFWGKDEGTDGCEGGP
jgi:hypothetical protein